MATPSEIRKPVLILGPERSGTTLLYSLLSNADEFYWFSRIDSKIPSLPVIAELSRRLFGLVDKKPYIARYGKVSRIRGLNPPSECNSYWKKYFGWGDEQHYQIKNDRFTERDLTVDQEQFIKNNLNKRLRYSGKKRVLLKQPGFSLKLSYWNRVFPDALYLICVRELEKNIASLVKTKKQSDEKFWGTKVNGWRDYLDADYQTQAAFQLKKIYSSIVKDLDNDRIVEQSLLVSYDRLISNPEQEARNILRFCDVKWNDRIRVAMRGITHKDALSVSDIDFSLSTPHILKEFENKANDLFRQSSNRTLT